MFKKELKKVYSEIDKKSDLLWSARVNSEFIMSSGPRTKRKSQAMGQDEGHKIVEESNASIGYGEITSVSEQSV